MRELNREYLLKIYKPKELENLDEIAIDNKSISKIHQNAFKGLSKLEWISLSENKILMIDPNSFEDLSNLKTLILEKNKLNKIDSNTFKGLKTLEVFDLSNNDISSIESNAFNDLSSLEELWLNINKLSKIDNNWFKNLVKLIELWLFENEIAEICSESFLNLANLQFLALSNNKLTKIDSNTFKGLVKLTALHLDHNHIVEIEQNSFECLENLIDLSLSFNKMKQIDSNTFKGLSNLIKLKLDNNEIEEIHPTSFCNLGRLKILLLNKNKLKLVDMDCFTKFTSISAILLYDNFFEMKIVSYYAKSLLPSDFSVDEEKLFAKGGCSSDFNVFLHQFVELMRIEQQKETIDKKEDNLGKSDSFENEKDTLKAIHEEKKEYELDDLLKYNAQNMNNSHLVVNSSNDWRMVWQTTSGAIMIKINKSFLVSDTHTQSFFRHDEYYKYAIELKVNNDYWVIFRRFSEIRKEHERSKSKYSELRKEKFPTRTPFNKSETFQMNRQEKLERYLKNYIQIAMVDIINEYSEKLDDSEESINIIDIQSRLDKLNKGMFCEHLGFFSERIEDKLSLKLLGWESKEETFKSHLHYQDESESVDIEIETNTLETYKTLDRRWTNSIADLTFQLNSRLFQRQRSKSTQDISSIQPLDTCKEALYHLDLEIPEFSLTETQSNILAAQQLDQIWRWLPLRYKILRLNMVFSTHVDGCCLMTLMNRCESFDTTVILVQTTTNSVFGAFCSQPWSKRLDKKFFGNGESFLFELSPRMVKWEWVGKKSLGETETGEELFQYADKDKIAVGGGNDFGLLIESDLVHGRSNTCNTFGNDSLGAEKDFEIAILEMFTLI